MFSIGMPQANGVSELFEPEIPLTTMMKVLGRLGFNFDPESPEDVEKAAQYVDDLVSDESKVDKLVTALGTTLEAGEGMDTHPVELAIAQPFVPVRILAEHTLADQDLMSDVLPSQSRGLGSPRFEPLVHASPSAL